MQVGVKEQVTTWHNLKIDHGLIGSLLIHKFFVMSNKTSKPNLNNLSANRYSDILIKPLKSIIYNLKSKNEAIPRPCKIRSGKW